MQATPQITEANIDAVDRWNDGAFDAFRGRLRKSDDADYLEGYRDGLELRKVHVVMPERAEGYYHSPIGLDA